MIVYLSSKAGDGSHSSTRWGSKQVLKLSRVYEKEKFRRNGMIYCMEKCSYDRT